MLVDLTAAGVTGKEAQEALDRAWITVNKNTIPFETRSPMVTSGIRIGTPAVTTRGMKEPEMDAIAGLIDRVLRARGDAEGRGLGAGGRRLACRTVSPLSGATRVKCPFCGHTEDRVVDSRVGRDGEFIRRRRECLKCNRRYTTYEYIEDILPMVVKRDGRREPFDRAKLRNSVLKACEKRSVGVQAVDDVVSDIETKLHERAEKEVSSRELGELVMARLQRLDQVAYVRFASVYRQFNDVTQFMDEVKGLIKKEPKEPEKTKRRKARGVGAPSGWARPSPWLTRATLDRRGREGSRRARSGSSRPWRPRRPASRPRRGPRSGGCWRRSRPRASPSPRRWSSFTRRSASSRRIRMIARSSGASMGSCGGFPARTRSRSGLGPCRGSTTPASSGRRSSTRSGCP